MAETNDQLPEGSPEPIATNPNAPIETRKSDKYLVFGKKYKNVGQKEGTFFLQICLSHHL